MKRKSFSRNVGLAGIAAVAIALSVAAAMSGPATPTAEADDPNETCTKSTASTHQLATIDKNGDDSFQCLGLSVAAGMVMGLRLETHSFTSSGRHPDAELVAVADFPVAVVESDRGAVLDGVPAHDAIILRGQFSVPPDNASLTALYLYNGFTGDYRSCQVTIQHVRGDGWRLADQFGKTISHIAVRTRKIPLLGMFGIANLDGACA